MTVRKGNMKVLAMVSHKGGSGKSTTSVHLAVAATMAGLKVLVVDCDHNSRSSQEWAMERESPEPVVVTAFPDTEELDIPESSLMERVVEFHEAGNDEGFDLMILDLPPYLNRLAILATGMADFNIIPAKPRFNDLRTVPRTVNKISTNDYTVLLSQCRPKVSGLEPEKTKEARELLVENGINVCPFQITLRESYSDALIDGRSVLEFEPHGKANHEITQLWNWVRPLLFKDE
ncbi:MAG: ParA family protein [Thiomicrospira sp.]|nr:ParA family protein [Thiomicrospira sp.]NCN67730.1 ParA family protein [Thiomicrospira sp.]NCO14849.1 ParA family protein [Thiomicrospira sp.]NCO80534.1 ParA family protein [Thiomicrospira sp.]OIP96486.1 MAG: hypothetical protein AUK56_01905 [Thiomicrospira sp. CG2_30_44_34]